MTLKLLPKHRKVQTMDELLQPELYQDDRDPSDDEVYYPEYVEEEEMLNANDPLAQQAASTGKRPYILY